MAGRTTDGRFPGSLVVMPRVLHKLKPEAYDPPKPAADASVWLGDPSGPAFDAWVAQSLAEPGGPDVTTAEAIFVCESGDLAADAAFEEMPGPELLAELGPGVTICAACWPDHAS